MAHALAADAKLARAAKNCKEESSDVGMVASTATEGEISARNARHGTAVKVGTQARGKTRGMPSPWPTSGSGAGRRGAFSVIFMRHQPLLHSIHIPVRCVYAERYIFIHQIHISNK